MSLYNNSSENKNSPYSSFLKIFTFLLFVSVTISVTGYTLGWFGEAASVAQKEFGADAALKKYEWFIEQSTMVAKMDQDVDIFRNKVNSVKKQYEAYGQPKDWTPDVRLMFNQSLNTAQSDLIAVISQRNGLVREYNAASSKFNWTPFKTHIDTPQVIYKEFRLE